MYLQRMYLDNVLTTMYLRNDVLRSNNVPVDSQYDSLAYDSALNTPPIILLWKGSVKRCQQFRLPGRVGDQCRRACLAWRVMSNLLSLGRELL